MRSTGFIALTLATGLVVACDRNNAQSHARDNTEPNPYVSSSSSEAVGTSGQASQTGQATRAGQTADTVSHGSDSDARNFAIQASKHGAAEVELGKLAMQKAQNSQVKQFADMMVRDHTKAGNELKQAVTPHGGTVSSELPDDSESLKAKLEKLNGAEFDRHYMAAMVDGHQQMKGMINGRIADAKRMTTSKSDLEMAVDGWAQKALPTVEQHLAKAQQINDALKNRSTGTH